MKTTKELREKIISLYKQGMKQHEITKHLNITDDYTVFGILKHNKLTPKFVRKTYINNDFFSFSKPEYSYIAGFLWADGFINKSLGFQIIQNDFNQIRHIFDSIGKWGYCFRSPKNRQPNVSGYICNTQLVQKLKNLEFDIKSSIFPSKIFDIIPCIYHHLFLRGYFDADGCFYYKNYCRQASFGAHIDFDWSFLFNWLTSIGLKTHKIHKMFTKGSKGSALRFTRKGDLITFGDYIYKDYPNICLPRKHQKYEQIKNSYL